MRKYLLLIALFAHVVAVFPQEVTFKASAPAAVVKGEQFRLSYILRNGEGSSPQFPNEMKGFDVLYGPSVSRSSSVQIINGRTTSDSSESYTFILVASEEGSFSVPAATIKVDGKSYTSNALTIKVLPPDKTPQAQAQPDARGGQSSSSSASSSSGSSSTSSSSSNAQNINSGDAFIRPIVTKTKVYEQEAFIISFKFYTTLNVRDIGKIEFPEFEGFMVEEQDLPTNRQLSLEHYNGRNYYAVDLRRSLLFPQRSGKITIPQGKIEMVFSVPSGRKVQSFFGPQEVMADVKRILQTNPVIIDVSPLPTGKPANFSNAVGSFSLKSSISDTEVKANDAITITLNIAGTGNLKLIKTPEIKFPTGFESYDPKVDNTFKIVESGLTGSKKIEYLFIPRYPGNYTIPAIEFSYFDLKSRTYKTLRSPEYNLKVDKDPNAGNNSAVSYDNQNEVKVIQDIRFLKTGKASYSEVNGFLVGSLGYVLWYLIPLLLFVLSFVYYRKLIEQNANIALMRTKKANKVATKRLKIAGVHLKEHNKEKFYEEILRATWGYLSDKLLIPAAELNRDNIELELSKYGVSEALMSRFMYILDTGEFARYAPSESDETMDKLYSETVNAISEMESIIKRKK
ncbi:BatD family protein [Viscerimonas tarda]